jgi:hypothetical protein
MKERLTELQERVESARAALEALAGRTAELRTRLETAQVQSEDPPFATVPVRSAPGGLGDDGRTTRDPFMPIRPGSLVSSLERLTREMRPIAASAADLGEGNDGGLVSDAWEIALINEEGK